MEKIKQYFNKSISPVISLIIIIALGFFIMGAVLICQHYFWQVKEEKPQEDGWKTYRNEEYGFEFEFPKGWNIYTDNAVDYDMVYVDIYEGAYKVGDPTSKNYMRIMISCEPRPNDLYDLEQWLLENTEIIKVEISYYNGAERADVLEVGGGVNEPYSILFNFHTLCWFYDDFYYFEDSYKGDYSEKAEEFDSVIKKINSTFKFTEDDFSSKESDQNKDIAVRADMGSLRAAAEIIAYNEGNSYENFNCQNEEAKKYCQSINNYSSGVQLTIHSSKDKYCAWVKLLSKENDKDKYFCVYESGWVETIMNSGNLGYCDGITYNCPIEFITD